MQFFKIEDFQGVKGLIAVILFVLFILSLSLLISGIKIKNKKVKWISIFFGSILCLTTLLAFVYTLLFGYNS